VVPSQSNWNAKSTPHFYQTLNPEEIPTIVDETLFSTLDFNIASFNCSEITSIDLDNKSITSTFKE